jgi:hypothetical protein
MILFNYEITLTSDYVTRAPGRSWFSIEKQEHAEEWEVLMGSKLLLVTRQGTRCTA